MVSNLIGINSGQVSVSIESKGISVPYLRATFVASKCSRTSGEFRVRRRLQKEPPRVGIFIHSLATFGMAGSSEVEAALITLGYPSCQELKWTGNQLDQSSAQDVIVWLCKKLPACHQPVFNESNDFTSEVSRVLGDIKSPLSATSPVTAVVYTITGHILANEILNKANKCPSTDLASTIEQLVKALSLPASNVASPAEIIDEITANAVKVVGQEESLFPSKGLTDKDWQHLKCVESKLKSDLDTRAEAMASRCETTIKSFATKTGLTDDSKKKLNEIAKTVAPKINKLTQFSLADAIAVRSSEEGRLLNSVVSSEKRQCKIKDPSGRSKETELRRYVIPAVPDRGGRTDEQDPLSNETFNDQYGDRPRGGFRGGGGRGRGGGDGRHRGGGGGHRGHRGGGGRGGGGHRGHRGGGDGHRGRGGDRNY